MADWTKQADEVMNTWTKAQQDLWDAWRRSMPAPGAANESWGKTLDFWKQAVDRSLGAQAEWARLWAESIKGQKGMPKEIEGWTDQMLATVQTWNRAQADFWERMLESVQTMSPDALQQRVEQGAQAAFDNWQEAMKRAIAAQEELGAFWAKTRKGD